MPLRYLFGPLGRGEGRASFIVPLSIETPFAQAPAEPGGDGPRISRLLWRDTVSQGPSSAPLKVAAQSLTVKRVAHEQGNRTGTSGNSQQQHFAVSVGSAL